MRVRNIPLLAAFAGAISISANAHAILPEQPETTDDMVVTQVSADPVAVSGIFAFAVQITGRVGIEERFYFIPFMAIGQPKPVVGERCAVVWRPWSANWNWLLADGQSTFAGRLVTTFRCGEQAF